MISIHIRTYHIMNYFNFSHNSSHNAGKLYLIWNSQGLPKWLKLAVTERGTVCGYDENAKMTQSVISIRIGLFWILGKHWCRRHFFLTDMSNTTLTSILHQQFWKWPCWPSMKWLGNKEFRRSVLKHYLCRSLKVYSCNYLHCWQDKHKIQPWDYLYNT